MTSSTVPDDRNIALIHSKRREEVMDLRDVTVKVVANISDKAIPFTGPIVEALLSDLLKVENEQLKILQQVEMDLARFMDGAWKSAAIYIEDAALPARTSDQVDRSLQLAAEKLHDAIPLQRERSMARAQARLDLAVVFRLLRDEIASRHHASIAYHDARSAMSVEVPKGGHRQSDPQDRLRNNWYDILEYGSALLADPLAENVVSDPLTSFEFEDKVQWRSGCDIDFRYIHYRQKRYADVEDAFRFYLRDGREPRAVRGQYSVTYALFPVDSAMLNLVDISWARSDARPELPSPATLRAIHDASSSYGE